MYTSKDLPRSDLSIGSLQYQGKIVPIIKINAVGTGAILHIVTNIGPVTKAKVPLCLKVRTGLDGKITNSHTMRVAFHNDILEWMGLSDEPAKSDLKQACKTINFALTGAYGDLSAKFKRFLLNILSQLS